jgi:hypothetical protein
MNPRFPIYIVSKGRADTRLTSRALETMGVPYHIIVEQQEYKKYCAVIDPKKVLILPKRYQDRYDTFSKLGEELGKGSGPARNFAWDHSIKMGAKWHWVMDDNISGFYRCNHNLKVQVTDGTTLRCMEEFCLRYKNIAMAGPNYFMFCSRKIVMPPFTLNTRIYSCNLIRNDVPFRWRGRYNEDTDLSLRMLKARWCTVLFNAFLQYKTTTLQMKGGNTDTIYKAGTMPKSRMLVEMHPDLARVVWKFKRWHHHVDYRPFKRLRLKLKPGIELKKMSRNDYGMELVKVTPKSRNKKQGAIR